MALYCCPCLGCLTNYACVVPHLLQDSPSAAMQFLFASALMPPRQQSWISEHEGEGENARTRVLVQRGFPKQPKLLPPQLCRARSECRADATTMNGCCSHSCCRKPCCGSCLCNGPGLRQVLFFTYYILFPPATNHDIHVFWINTGRFGASFKS